MGFGVAITMKLPDQQSIGFAGLAPHEKATIDLAQRIYPSGLNRIREITDLRNANVIFADPASIEGRAVLGREGTYVIAVQDRRESLPPGADSALHRPLSPRAVLESLNRIEGHDHDHRDLSKPTKPRGLAALLHELMVGTSSSDAWLLRHGSEPMLVVQPARDRIRGNLERLDIAGFRDDTTWSAEPVSSESAGSLLPDDQERPLCRTFWALARDRFAGSPLFGQDDPATFGFRRWPNLSVAGIAGDFLRAISLLRHGSFDVRGACRKTGLSEREVTVLFNACWLNGDLVRVNTPVGPGAGKARLSSGVNTSVLARIRNRLAGV